LITPGHEGRELVVERVSRNAERPGDVAELLLAPAQRLPPRRAAPDRPEPEADERRVWAGAGSGLDPKTPTATSTSTTRRALA
jgi:hypothetical protein